MSLKLERYVLGDSVLSNAVFFEKRMYSDESCLEKISSKQYKAVVACEEPRTRDRSEIQKRLVKKI